MKLVQEFALLSLLAVVTVFQPNAEGACHLESDGRGNYYTICTDRPETPTQGRDSENERVWEPRIERDGTYHGVDNQGNVYQGNARTGHYFNYGTGETCTGHGAGRVCTAGQRDSHPWVGPRYP